MAVPHPVAHGFWFKLSINRFQFGFPETGLQVAFKVFQIDFKWVSQIGLSNCFQSASNRFQIDFKSGFPNRAFILLSTCLQITFRLLSKCFEIAFELRSNCFPILFKSLSNRVPPIELECSLECRLNVAPPQAVTRGCWFR